MKVAQEIEKTAALFKDKKTFPYKQLSTENKKY